jgi:hypothetical protein
MPTGYSLLDIFVRKHSHLYDHAPWDETLIRVRGRTIQLTLQSGRGMCLQAPRGSDEG